MDGLARISVQRERLKDSSTLFGFGRKIKSDGSLFEGFFDKSGELFGIGKVILNNDTAYIGSLSNSLRHGKGSLIHFATGLKEQGQWNQGRKISEEL